MDVTDFGRVPAKIKAAAAVHGRIDILISNCGIGSQGSVLDTELDVYKQLMNTNFFGQVAVIRGKFSFRSQYLYLTFNIIVCW